MEAQQLTDPETSKFICPKCCRNAISAGEDKRLGGYNCECLDCGYEWYEEEEDGSTTTYPAARPRAE